jgi:predicted N-acetyltransferase YhbS
VYTALQAVASPLGHSTEPAPHVTLWRPLRADDGIRTRDPHLGKVMRYQLRYVRLSASARFRGQATEETLAGCPEHCQTGGARRVAAWLSTARETIGRKGPRTGLDVGMNFRQITAAERTATMFPLQAYAFMPSPWPAEDEEKYRRRMRYYETAVSLIAEEEGEALAGVTAFRMQQNVRGLVHDMAGVASVSSHPSARRRGLVRALLERLLRQMREEGCAVSALYPFRPSFYARLGFVGIPRHRTAAFAPEGLAHLTRAELPGEVVRRPMKEGFDDWDALTRRLLHERHGFSVYDETRTAEFRESKEWLAIARVDGEVVGAVPYRIDEYGGDLVAGDMLTTGPLGRALLLQFFGRHVDQVARVVVTISTDEVPELWGTDFAVTTEGRVNHPRKGGAMARALDMPALSGTPAGPGDVTIEIPDDELIGGVWRLTGEEGRLTVAKGSTPTATLAAAGFSALLYGVLDPIEVFTRGLGELSPEAVPSLTALFPRQMPYIFADF